MLRRYSDKNGWNRCAFFQNRRLAGVAFVIWCLAFGIYAVALYIPASASCILCIQVYKVYAYTRKNTFSPGKWFVRTGGIYGMSFNDDKSKGKEEEEAAHERRERRISREKCDFSVRFRCIFFRSASTHGAGAALLDQARAKL